MGAVPWLTVGRAPVLVSGVVHVWWAAPEAVAPLLGDLHDLLDDSERDRLDRLRRPADRDRFVVGCALLKHAAAAQLDTAPSAVRLVRRCPDCDRPHGKPTIPGSEVELSLAHSGDRVAVAVALGTPVGVDVEQVLPTLDPAPLVGTVLTAREAAALAALPAASRRTGFLHYWTRKEAVLKATGEGLRVSMRHVEVTGPLEPPRVLALNPGRPEEIALLGLDAGHGHIAALAVIGQAPSQVLELDAAALLHETAGS